MNIRFAKVATTLLMLLAACGDEQPTSEGLVGPEGPQGPAGETGLRFTVSAGVAAAPEHGVSPIELLEHADQALYRAKRCGKDLWMLHAPEDGTAAERPSA